MFVSFCISPISEGLSLVSPFFSLGLCPLSMSQSLYSSFITSVASIFP